jgi:hypothetical protein
MQQIVVCGRQESRGTSVTAGVMRGHPSIAVVELGLEVVRTEVYDVLLWQPCRPYPLAAHGQLPERDDLWMQG